MKRAKHMKKKKSSQQGTNKKFWFFGILSLIGLAVIIFTMRQQTQLRTNAQQAPGIVANHTTNADNVSQAELDAARQLDILFNHQSVGNNILEGIAGLQSQNPTRYTIGRASNPGADWYTSNAGIGDFMEGENGNPASKVSGFDGLIRGAYGSVVNVAFMKYCFVDFGSADTAWNAYRPAMEGLIRSYPNISFVWVTTPLETTSGNEQRAAFNNYVRQYVQTNGGYLLDIAAIESHDPSGNAINDGSGSEALYPGYASDTGHLNGTGAQRVASSLWYLLAQITRRGTTAPTSGNLVPTMWCMGGVPCSSPAPTNNIPVTTIPDNPGQPNVEPTLDPCQDVAAISNSEKTKHHSKHHKKHKSDDSDSQGDISQFIQQLLNWIRQLLEQLGITFPDMPNMDDNGDDNTDQPQDPNNPPAEPC